MAVNIVRAGAHLASLLCGDTALVLKVALVPNYHHLHTQHITIVCMGVPVSQLQCAWGYLYHSYSVHGSTCIIATVCMGVPVS